MRVRGLKLTLDSLPTEVAYLSHPVRVRGLKLLAVDLWKACCFVAPRAGAWIETEEEYGQKLQKVEVAPRAGAWIETLEYALIVINLPRSHPVRVRGLKLHRKHI